jgi:hypothetical protein
MTNAERRERRREAALKGAKTRAARQAPPDGPGPVADPEPPDGPTGRQLIERAQSIGREADLWYHAHLRRWPTWPSAWTAAQRAEAEAFLAKFIRPDGLPQPVRPRRRKPR